MIKELIAQVRSANNAYAKGIPYLTDKEYDVLWKKLYDIDPHCKDLYHTSYMEPKQSYEYHHLKPIYGTQKAFNIEDLMVFLMRFPQEDLIIQPKYDGIGAVLYRTDHSDTYKLIKQGDGKKGRDITHHLDKIIYQPFKTPTQEVELIIPNAQWKSEWGANQRNVVDGWMKRDKLDRSGIVVAARHDGLPAKIFSPPHEAENINNRLLKLYYEWKEAYPMDGVMLKVLNPTSKLKASHNGTVHLWSVAWKPPISTEETEILEIEWNVSRLGRVIPRIKYEPISLCGTMNQWVTGNNAKWLKDRLICVGDTIVIGKAGEIIPQFLKIKHKGRKNFFMPSHCPICDTLLVWEDTHLVCNGPECITKVSKSIAYFYSDKGMNLKSIGEAMITDLLHHEKLYELLFIRPWALLDPDTYDLYTLLDFIWGEARTSTYVKELDLIQSTRDPAHFVAALGYKNMAYKKAMQNWQILKETRNAKQCSAVFLLALDKWLKASTELKHFKFLPVPEAPRINYVITGTLSVDRKDIIAYLTKHDWQVGNTVTKATDIVILGELARDSTKLKRAKELDTIIITEDQIGDFIKREE